jgi:hypothetical protein
MSEYEHTCVMLLYARQNNNIADGFSSNSKNYMHADSDSSTIFVVLIRYIIMWGMYGFWNFQVKNFMGSIRDKSLILGE